MLSKLHHAFYAVDLVGERAARLSQVYTAWSPLVFGAAGANLQQQFPIVD